MPPLIGLGTYLLKGKACQEAVRAALKMGYRHIDTAFDYGNHKEIGKVIREWDRSELFLTSKFTVDLVLQKSSIEKEVEKVLQLALKELQVDYLDLMLIHWPKFHVPLEEIFSALHHQVLQGSLRAAGVSNYTRHHLQDAYHAGLTVSYNQVEFHPYLYQRELLDFCRAHGTQLIAYRPLGNGELLKEPLFAKIGQKHSKSPAQVILRWIIQKGVPVIPKGSTPEHLRENFSILDFFLSDQEMIEIDKLNRFQRFCEPDSPVFNY